jgi:uncharacterized lipoprotein YmbA
MKFSRFASFSLCAVALGLGTGCNLLPEPQPDNTRFYVLGAAAPATAPAASAPRVGLRRVDVPAYLKSKSLVSLRGNHELRYDDTARWAEPLDAGILRALRDQLAGRAAVSVYPFPTQVERDFDVTVQIAAAEGRDDGVHFAASYEVVRVSDARVVARRTFTAPVTAWNGDPAQLADRLSVAVAGLADDIVGAWPAQ